jgi:hypothetical protein
VKKFDKLNDVRHITALKEKNPSRANDGKPNLPFMHVRTSHHKRFGFRVFGFAIPPMNITINIYGLHSSSDTIEAVDLNDYPLITYARTSTGTNNYIHIKSMMEEAAVERRR